MTFFPTERTTPSHADGPTLGLPCLPRTTDRRTRAPAVARSPLRHPTGLVVVLWLAVQATHPASPAYAEELPYDPGASAEEILDALLSAPKAQPAWHAELELRQGAGYTENVYFSPFDARNSSFSSSEAELFIYRQTDSPHRLSLYAYGSHRHYLELDRNNGEYSAIAQGGWEYAGDSRASCGLRGDYFFFDQFFDASLSDAEIDSTRLKEHDLGASSFARYALWPWLTAELAGAGKAAIQEDSTDDYRQWEASTTLKGQRRSGLTFALTYGYRMDDYDQRERRTAIGEPLDGDPVRIGTHQVRADGLWYCDTAHDWRLRWRLTRKMRNDDGGGYYDYESWQGLVGLRGRMGSWQAEVSTDYTDTQYDERPSDYLDATSPPLQRQRWGLDVRVDRELGKRWKLFAAIEWEDNDANEAFDVYRRFTGVAGLGFNMTAER